MSLDLYKLLTNHINQRYVELKATNIFYQSIFDGTIKPEIFTRFLANTSFLTSHTPQHLAEAIAQTRKNGQPMLCEYFTSKAEEEVGHEKWGEEDIKGITGRRVDVSKSKGIHPAMLDMVSANSQMIATNPYHYFIYILFAEYYTVLAGPECMAAVERACGIPQKHMSIIGNHAELDKLHVKEWAADSKTLGNFGLSEKEHLKVLDQIMDRHDRFTTGLALKKRAA